MIYKRGKIWYIGYSVNGRLMREAIGESRKFAEIVLGKKKAEVREGRFLNVKKNEKIKFEDFAKTFIELHSKLNKRPRVAKRDEQLINRLSEHFSGKYLYEITPKQIEEYKKTRKEAKRKGGKTIAAATVNRELACLKCMFNKAIEWNKADENPVRKVKLFKENNKRIRYLEKEEIKKLLDNSNGNIRSIIIVALNTGMRKSEILGLKWHDIDIEKGIIYLLDTKNGEKREVQINENVKKTLISVPKNAVSPYIFCKEDGSPYKDVRKYFDTVLKRCGIINFRFHDLRHTFCSQLVMAGIDIKTVQELVGHKSITMTLRYSHLSPDHKKRALDILGNRISTKMTQTPKIEEVNEMDKLHNSLKELELNIAGEVA